MAHHLTHYPRNPRSGETPGRCPLRLWDPVQSPQPTPGTVCASPMRLLTPAELAVIRLGGQVRYDDLPGLLMADRME